MDRTPSPDLPPQEGQTSSARRRNTMFTRQYAFGTSSRSDTTLRSIQQEQERDQRLDRTLDAISRRALHDAARPLLDNFSQYFPESIVYIQGCTPTMKWVAEAANHGVNFCGYAEDGPRSNTQSYALDKDVYTPRTQ